MKIFSNKCCPKWHIVRKLLGVLEADGILLYTPLLQSYIENGLELQAVYTTGHKKILAWFVEQETDACRMGDTDKEVFKLLENSSYGKMLETLERHTNVSYTKDEKLWTVHYGRHGSKT